jgi:hypothetical protein
MPLFSVAEAQHFCRGFRRNRRVPQTSFRQFCQTLGIGAAFVEGTPQFNALRIGALREVDRLLFLAASNYRRSFDLLMPGSSAWAHVTMYYSTFFSGAALLGMFGNWKLGKKTLLDVTASTPGAQRFQVVRFSTSFVGSHDTFWDLFYANVAPLVPLVDPALRFAIAPIGGNVAWQSAARNDVNYDSHVASRAMGAFQGSYSRVKFPSKLPGALNSQFRVMETLLHLTIGFARQLGVRTDALDHLAPPGRRSTKVRQLVFDARVPALPRAVRRAKVIG